MNLINKMKKQASQSYGSFKAEMQRKKNIRDLTKWENKMEKRIIARKVRDATIDETRKQSVRAARRKVKSRFSKGNSGGSKIASRVMSNLKTKGTPGFMELPGSNNKKKGDDAFNFF